MGNKTSRVKTVEGDTHSRGSSGCFGWVCNAFKRKKRGQRHHCTSPSNSPATEKQEKKEQDEGVPFTSFSSSSEEHSYASDEDVAEREDGLVEACNGAPATEDVGEELVGEEQEPEIFKSWAEEVDDAEERGLDVFAPMTSCLPHAACVPNDTSDSAEHESTAAATASKMSACQRRRVRHRALAAALRASAENEATATTNCAARPPRAGTTAPAEHSDEPAAPDTTLAWPTISAQISDDQIPATTTPNGATAARRRRTRRKALAAALKSSAESEAAAATNCEARPPRAETSAPTEHNDEPTPAARASDGHASATEAAATHSEASRTMQRKARRRALAARLRSEARLAASTDRATITMD